MLYFSHDSQWFLYLFQIKKSRYFLNVNYKLILEQSNWFKSIILDFIQLSIKSACIPHQSFSFKLSCVQLTHKFTKHSLTFHFSTRNTKAILCCFDPFQKSCSSLIWTSIKNFLLFVSSWKISKLNISYILHHKSVFPII